MKKKDMSKLPIYNIEIDDTDHETGVNLISIVADPAIQVSGVCLAAQIELDDEWEEVSLADFSEYDPTPPCHVNCRCSIVNGEWQILPDACEACFELKAEWEEKRDARRKGANTIRRIRRRTKTTKVKFSQDEEKMILAGPFLIPEKLIYRNDDSEYYIKFSAEVIRKIQSKFQRTKNNKSINLDHTTEMSPAYILESWIVESESYDKSRLYGFDSSTCPKGTWFCLVQVTDKEFWDDVVKGQGKASFSIEGVLGQRLEELYNQPISMSEMIDSLSEEELIEILKEL